MSRDESSSGSCMDRWIEAGFTACALMAAGVNSYEGDAMDDHELYCSIVPLLSDLDQDQLRRVLAWLSRIAAQSLIEQAGSIEGAREGIRQTALELSRLELERTDRRVS